MINVQTLVDAHLYPSADAAVEDALRALLRDKPQLRIELAIHRYRTEDLSLARAAHLAGVSFERMRELLVERSLQPRLGPEDEQAAKAEVAAMQKILAK